MRRFTPLRPDPGALLARANPVAKLGGAALLMAVLFVSSGLATPGVVLLGLAACLPLTGVAPRDLLARTWPMLAVALSVGVLNVVFAPSGAGTVATGLFLGLRLLGIALAGTLALVSTDPTDLADALQQQLRLSPRLALGVLAAVRMLPMLSAEWQILAMARRARGVGAGRSPLAAARLSLGMLLALLVGAVRRATRLAASMESRGLGAAPCRTHARPQRIRPGDWLLLAAAALLAVCAAAAGFVA